MDTRMVFTSRLTQLRGKRSRNSVAAEMGIASETLRKYEKGERLPQIDIAAEIAKYYGVSVDWLLGIENPNTSKKEFVCMVAKYTGLSEESAELLHKYHNPPYIVYDQTLEILDDLITSEVWFQLGRELITLESCSKQLMEIKTITQSNKTKFDTMNKSADIAKLHCKEILDDIVNSYDARRSDLERFREMREEVIMFVEKELGVWDE